MAVTAANFGWGSGYPHCQTGKIKTLVRADGLRIPLREELIPLFAWLMDETEKRGYDIRPGETWGYACRSIRGYPSVPSNHSWGSAADINAPSNPMLYGKPGWAALRASGRTDMPSWMPPLWEAHGFRWGGNYSNRQDAMHYEFMLTPADAARIIADLRGGTSPTSPGFKLPIHHTHPAEKSDTIKVYQALLNNWIRRHRPGVTLLKEDGVYGDVSAVYTHAFKAWVIDLQTAFGIKPVWPNTDTGVGPVTFGGAQYWANH